MSGNGDGVNYNYLRIYLPVCAVCGHVGDAHDGPRGVCPWQAPGRLATYYRSA